MLPALFVGALSLLAGCVPDVPIDPDAPDVANALSGTVAVNGAETLGPVLILLYDPADPPPPTGTGAPLTFATVPAEAFTGASAGMQSAPWSLTGVADGTWLVTALMDVDGDFQPFLGSNSGATCGDWLGAHVGDLNTGDVAPITVSGGLLVDDVTVVIGTEMTTERPAFTIQTSAVSQTSAETQLVTLQSTGIHSEIVDLGDPGTDCGVYFPFYAPDSDGDGQLDPHPTPALAQAGLFDVWPRVYLQYAGDDLEQGEGWATEAPLYPTPILTGEATVGVPAAVTSVDAVFVPAAVHTLPDGTEETVYAPNLPAGPWSVTVISFTGQTWSVPNEVAAFGATVATFDPAGQGATLLVE